MLSRHYTRKSKRPRRKMHPDMELALALEARGDFKPSTTSERIDLRGIPAIKATETRVSPRWKESHSSTWTQGTVRAGKRSSKRTIKPTAPVATHKQTDRDLMATMGSIHGNTQ